MQRARVLGRPGDGRRVSAAARRAQRRLETFRSLSRRRRLDELVELAADDHEMAAELRVAARLGRGAPGAARGGAALLGSLRRRRRGRHDQRGRRRHRLAGLGRDAVAHVPALGRTARLPGRDEGGLAGRGGRAQVRDRSSSGRERLRAVRRRARRASADPDLARSTRRRAGTPASPRSTSRRSSRTTSRSRSTTRTSGSTPTAPRAPVASTSTRPTRPFASPTCRPGSSPSRRTSARRPRTRRRRCRSCAPGCWSEEELEAGRGARPRAGRAEGGRVGLPDPQLLPPSPISGSRTTAPDFEVGDAQRVLDGDIDGFVREYLLQAAD